MSALSLRAIDKMCEAMFAPHVEPAYILYSCDGHIDEFGCCLSDAVQIAVARNIEDIDASSVPSNRIAVLWDEDASEWCVWDTEREEWISVSGDGYHFDIKFRQEV